MGVTVTSKIKASLIPEEARETLARSHSLGTASHARVCQDTINAGDGAHLAKEPVPWVMMAAARDQQGIVGKEES